MRSQYTPRFINHYVKVTSCDLVGDKYREENKKNSGARLAYINHAYNKGYSKLGVQLFQSNYYLEEFLEDLKTFNDIYTTVVIYFPELNGIISVKDINLYVESLCWNNNSISPDLNKRLSSLIDRLVDIRYEKLKRKYNNILDFPDKRTLFTLYANSNYTEALKNGYEYLKRKYTVNKDLYMIGEDIANIDVSYATDCFYSDILKYFIANYFGEKQSSSMATYLLDNYVSRKEYLEESVSITERLKTLFPDSNLFQSLFVNGYVSSFDSIYSPYEKFGRIIYSSYSSGRFALVKRMDNLRLIADDLKDELKAMDAYNDFINQFKKLKNFSFISFEQFKHIFSDDDSYYNAILRGYDIARNSDKNKPYVTFGKKLAMYAQSEANNDRSANDISMKILFELLDSFKEPLWSLKAERYRSVLKKYPILDDILSFDEFYQMFKPNTYCEIVEFGYSDAKRGYSKIASNVKKRSSR